MLDGELKFPVSVGLYRKIAYRAIRKFMKDGGYPPPKQPSSAQQVAPGRKEKGLNMIFNLLQQSYATSIRICLTTKTPEVDLTGTCACVTGAP